VLDSLEQESPFDLLISDILMPNVDGITLVEQVKKAYPTTPILLISGHPDLCAKARQVGADWCLEKPFSYYDLLTAVEEVLKHRA
jgi:DNA-binding NtrC family response regulator